MNDLWNQSTVAQKDVDNKSAIDSRKLTFDLLIVIISVSTKDVKFGNRS